MEGGWGDRASVGEWLLKEATLVSTQYAQPVRPHTVEGASVPCPGSAEK